jgi:hypothetical protein
MTVFVCFYNYGSYEGCSTPTRVFKTEEEAEKWIKEDGSS